MDEFVIEKYIEINVGISIVYADPHSYNTIEEGDRERIHIFIANDIIKKLTLVCSSSWRLQKTAIEIYL